jgi:predicted Ser/Thr protein kinase
VGSLDTIASGERMARPDFGDPEERRRRQALKAKLFGESEDAVKIGRFQVLGRLGAGGMGVVYAAYDERLDRKIAIKVLRQDSGQSKHRLLREAQAMARLSHPNIVGVHEVGEDGDSVFVAMEFVRGKSLDRWLEEPRPWREVLAVFMAAGRGLQAAHEAGLIHRDFKPANAILADDGRVKVLDFGLARAGGATEVETGEGSLMAVRLTRTGAMMGTPAYMSPEQFAAEELTAASDQFSFFIALYEALYRKLPFTGETVGALAVSVTRGKPAEPTSSEVPSWIRAVVMRGLARAPADRFPDMAAVLAALGRDPARRRRRLAAVLGLVVASGGVSAGAMSLVAADGGRCEGVAAATKEVWNDERIAAAGAAFAGRAGVLGEETWSLIQPRIGGWIDEWVRLRDSRCTAYAAGELSDTLHDRSVACLERQLARVDALVTAFVVADATSVEQAPVAVAALPSLALCSDSEALLAEVPPPDDPQARERVASGRASLERARAAIDLGDYAGALAQADMVSGEARALRYEPLIAFAELIRGDALHWQRDFAGSEAALGAGLELALASGDERVAVEALARRIYVRAEILGEPARALADAAIDRALLRRVPGDARLAWLVENNIAVAEERAGHDAAAERGHVAAGQLAAGIGDGASFEAMVSQYNLGLLHGQRGDPMQAAAMIAAAVATGERLQGPNHPALLVLLEGQASALVELGRWREASAICQRGRALAARLTGVGPTLLPLLELEATIAGNRRSPAAETMAAEVVALAEADSGAGSHRAKFAALRSWPYSEAHEPELAAARAAVKTMSLPMWAETSMLRADAMLDAGRSPRALIDEVRADEAWASVPPRLRITIGLFAARVAVDEGRAVDAARELGEVEALGRDAPPFAMQMQVDHIRGELATRAGDPRAAVSLLRRAAEACATFDEDHPRRLAVRASLARALRASGATAEAEEVGRDVIRLYRSLGAGFEPEASALAAWLGAANGR